MLKKLIFSKTSKQTLILFIAQIFSMVVGFVSNMLLAKEMGVETFGIYSFASAVISFLAIFFEFGYFASASRLLAINHDKSKEKEYLGASVVIASVIAFSFFIMIFIVSFVVDSLFKDKIEDIIRIASIVSWSFILPFFMELILKGSNHIESMAWFNIAWKVLFVISLFILYYVELLTPLNVLIWFSITGIVGAVFFIFKLKPSFDNLKLNISRIHEENKVYGLHIYTGRVIDVSTYQLDRLLIAFFIGAKDVGLYSLANSMANPINSFSAALASSKFKDLANNPFIPTLILKINFLWISVAVVGANTLGYLIIYHYLGAEYHDVFLLLVLMSLAVGSQAAYQPYNAWLSGHGYGEELKRMSYFMAFFNFFGNITLIPFFGAVGATIASIMGTLAYLLVSLKYYKRFKNEK